jgi:DNA mismatch endonuclease (patch repair protein)
MPDVFTKSKRSEVMSRIRSAGNKATELAMIRVFRDHGITGWRRGQRLRLLESGDGRSDTGERRIIRPDFVFPVHKIAVFVDGEFWHGHPTRCRIPATRRAWWLAKIEGNRARDRLQNRLLRANGWTVVRIWQHELERKRRARRKLRAAGLAGNFEFWMLDWEERPRFAVA